VHDISGEAIVSVADVAEATQIEIVAAAAAIE